MLIKHTAVSAFAARQKLWGIKPNETAPAEPAEDKQEEVSSAQDSLPSRPASTRKRKNQRQEDQFPTLGTAAGTERRNSSRPPEDVSVPELSSEGVQE
jgi:polynucleotide 5'-hydroxyl-kinase GRC3/NOL9